MSYGASRKPLFKPPINYELLKKLRENFFLDDLLSIISTDKKTELEEAILTSIYWIGEAQNDFNHTDAFIKYWIALETLFSIFPDPVSISILRPLPVARPDIFIL